MAVMMDSCQVYAKAEKKAVEKVATKAEKKAVLKVVTKAEKKVDKMVD